MNIRCPERARSEEQRQREELKVKLQLSELAKIEHREGDDSLLSWKPIQEATPTPPTYSALMYTDQKEVGQEIYKWGAGWCCVVCIIVFVTVALSVSVVSGPVSYYPATNTSSLSLLAWGTSLERSLLVSVHVIHTCMRCWGKCGVCAYVFSLHLSPGCILEVPARPPCKPLPPKVGTRSKSSLTLRWNAPQDNGSSITCYELEWDQCKGDWVRLNSDKTKQFKFNHRFLPSSVAEFRIRASNEVGWRWALSLTVVITWLLLL